MRRTMLILTILFTAAGLSKAQTVSPTLLQKPAVSKTQVAFAYAADLWIVGREGGEAVRLTTGIGIESDPVFSPDGSTLAFTGQYDGNVDVYVIPAAGGVPKRLTFHPGVDEVAGWTPDGKSILFRSNRNSYSPRYTRLFTVSLEGGFPTELPLPMGSEGSFSPDGGRLAYMPISRAFDQWKKYRGGQMTKIWLARLSDSSIEEIPRQNSN